MNSNLTYLVFVVDRSGSMTTIAKDMIGGFNSYIKQQRDAKLGDCKVFFYQFDTAYERVYEATDLDAVPVLTDKTYVPRGGTALYDSLGKTITELGTRLANLPEDERPGKVLVITITDGEDNARLVIPITDGEDNARLEGEDTFYSSVKVKEMVQHQTDTYKWDFVYIGANQDAWAVGGSTGHKGSTSLNYVATAAGTAVMFDKLSKSSVKYRSVVSGPKMDFAFEPEDHAPTP